MNINTTSTVASKLQPGVTFTLRRFTERRRLERELALSTLRDKAQTFAVRTKQLLNLTDDDPAVIMQAITEADKETTNKLSTLHAERMLFELTEWYPAWIKWGISKVDGFEVDGTPGTLGQYCEEGDRPEIEEAFNIVYQASELPEDAKKNSESLGTSDKQEDGKTPLSIATDAEQPAHT